MIRVFSLLVLLCSHISLWGFETAGVVRTIERKDRAIVFKGEIKSDTDELIDGYKVSVGKRTYVAPNLSAKKGELSFAIPIGQIDRKIVKNALIKIIPVISSQRGNALYTLYQPTLPMPEAIPGHSVGKGDFLQVSCEVLSFLVNQGGLQPHHQVLDVGCGLGRIAYSLSYFLSQEARYEGFDIDPILIAKAKEKMGKSQSNFRFQHIDAHNPFYNEQGVLPSCFEFPYPDESFDFVFLSSVFTHMLGTEVRHYLSEIERVLKPEGRCLITCFLMEDESRQLIIENSGKLTFIHTWDDGYIQDPLRPESAVAFEKDLFLTWCDEARLSCDAIHPGRWCGRKNFCITSHDLVVLHKKDH